MRLATQILSYIPYRPREKNKYHYWVEVKPDQWLEYCHPNYRYGDLRGRPGQSEAEKFRATFQEGMSTFRTEDLQRDGRFIIHEH